jgi:hypothetical protein
LRLGSVGRFISTVDSQMSQKMRFDIYGRYQLEVVREADRWVMYKLDYGKRLVNSDFVIPASLHPDEIATYINDILHEWARPGETVRRIS